jgi:hypothetical protein
VSLIDGPPTIEERILDALRISGQPMRLIDLKRSEGLSHRSMADIRRAAWALVRSGELIESWLPSRRFYARDNQRLQFSLPV